MSDPLVRIADEAGREYQVFKSNFHRLYESLGYKITFLIGDSEGPNEVAPPDGAQVAPETTLEHTAPPPPVVDDPATPEAAQKRTSPRKRTQTSPEAPAVESESAGSPGGAPSKTPQ